MNIFTSFRYQMADQKKGIIAFYIVVLAISLLSFCIVLLPVNGSMLTVTTGMSSITAIYMFVAGLCSFKENFGMSLQNGVSRRSMFIARLATTAALSAILAVVDEVLTYILILPYKIIGVDAVSRSLYVSIFGTMDNVLLQTICSVAFGFFVLMAASAAGYFITIMFYRLNKLGKILVGAGVPFLFMFVLPIALELMGPQLMMSIGSAVSSAIEFMVSLPHHAMLSSFIFFAVASGFSWLMMRRACVK